MVDAKLRAETAALLPADEELESVFVGIAGVRPGMEAVISILLIMPAMTFSIPVGFAVGCVLATWFYSTGRSCHTVAVTNRALVILRNSRWRWRRPKWVEERLALDVAITAPDRNSGDKKIVIGGRSFWVIGPDLDESIRIATTCRDANRSD